MNELGPTFAESMYSATVNEDHGINSGIGVTVSASDAEGHSVTYSINPNFQDGYFFSISQSSGVISLTQSLDRDPPFGHDSFTFQVYIQYCIPRVSHAQYP